MKRESYITMSLISMPALKPGIPSLQVEHSDIRWGSKSNYVKHFWPCSLMGRGSVGRGVWGEQKSLSVRLFVQFVCLSRSVWRVREFTQPCRAKSLTEDWGICSKKGKLPRGRVHLVCDGILKLIPNRSEWQNDVWYTPRGISLCSQLSVYFT